MTEQAKGGFVFLNHKIDEPIPPEMLAQMPAYIRPYAERARLAMLEADKKHRAEDGHSFDGSPACLAAFISMELRDVLKSGKIADAEAVRLATALMALGSVIAFVVDTQRALEVGKAISRLLGPIQAADIPGKSAGDQPDTIPFRGPKKGTS
jgi:hypothetical protein